MFDEFRGAYLQKMPRHIVAGHMNQLRGTDSVISHQKPVRVKIFTRHSPGNLQETTPPNIKMTMEKQKQP